MYNNLAKETFKKENINLNTDKTLAIIAEAEEKFNKNICDFTYEEISEFISDNKGVINKKVLEKYINFLIENCHCIHSLNFVPYCK